MTAMILASSIGARPALCAVGFDRNLAQRRLSHLSSSSSHLETVTLPTTRRWKCTFALAIKARPTWHPCLSGLEHLICLYISLSPTALILRQEGKESLNHDKADAKHSGTSGAWSIPTLNARAVMASVYVWPLSEGLFRLVMVTADALRQGALELMLWCELQLCLASRNCTSVTYTTEDLATLAAIGLRCRDVLGDLSRLLGGMLMISPSAAAVLPHIQAASVQATLWSPVSFFDMSCLLFILVVACWAFAGMSNGSAQRQTQTGQPGRAAFPFAPGKVLTARDAARLPKAVADNCCCALLLRLGLAPLASMSSVCPDLYRTATILLTLATTCTAAAILCQVLWGHDEVEDAATAALRQAGNLAVGHMALLALDWVLLVLLTQAPVALKLQAGAAMAVLAAGLLLVRRSPDSLLA